MMNFLKPQIDFSLLFRRKMPVAKSPLNSALWNLGEMSNGQRGRRSHITPQFYCALKFFFGDLLTWDDVLDWHGGIVMQNRQTPLPSTTRYARVHVP